MWPFRRRAIGLLVWLGCTIGLLYGFADLAGRSYFSKRAAWRVREIATEQAKTEAYRRTLVTEDSTQQNAALWYRRSFAKLRLLPEERARTIARAIARQSTDNRLALRTLATNFCEEAQSRRVYDALGCTKCDWGLASLNNDDQIDSSQAWLLGNCMVLQGYLSAAEREPAIAAKAYFEALSFASDLAQADYSTTLVGMTVARASLEGLGKLLAAVGDDIHLLQETGKTLSRFAATLPRVDAGLRLARLKAATSLQIDATAPVGTDPWVLNHLAPWRLVAAWRLSREESPLNLLLQLSDARNTNDRERLAKQIDDVVTTTTNQTVRDNIPDGCLGAVKSEEYLHHIYTAIQAALELQERRLNEGLFPLNAMSLTLSLDQEGLDYESLEGGKGFRIVMGKGKDSRTLVEQRAGMANKSTRR